MSPFLHPSLDNSSAVDPRHMRDICRQLLRAMGGQYPVVSAARALQRSSQLFARTYVQAIEDLIEQQHASITRERTSDQHQSTLSVRQRQDASSSQTGQTESLQHAGHALALSARRLSQRDVFVEEPGRHDLCDGQVPAVPHIFILALRADVRDLLLAEAAMALLMACRCRPHVAAEHLQEERLARAVRTDQCPALASMQGEVDLVEHDVAVEDQRAT